MHQIGIIGPYTCVDKTKKVKELLFQIKQTFGNTATIFTGGNLEGIEHDVKKYALQFDLPFKEFNPRHTYKTPYSYFDVGFYGKPYHVTNFLHRYLEMLKYIDKLVVGVEKNTNNKIYQAVITAAIKKQIKIVLI